MFLKSYRQDRIQVTFLISFSIVVPITKGSCSFEIYCAQILQICDEHVRDLDDLLFIDNSRFYQ